MIQFEVTSEKLYSVRGCNHKHIINKYDLHVHRILTHESERVHGSAEIEASRHQVSIPYRYYQDMYMYDSNHGLMGQYRLMKCFFTLVLK